jgi:Lrp/AsnC family transcriptional regulator, regulator for asnA, asnC and gidA
MDESRLTHSTHVVAPLTGVDRKIIAALQRNSRRSLREIAREVKASPATVMHHLGRLEKEKVIKGYTATVDYDLLDIDVHALIEVRVQKGQLFEVERKIAHHPHVYAVYDTTGHFDAVILCRFPNRKALDRFLKDIQTYQFVERTETRIILNTIKESHIDLG